MKNYLQKATVLLFSIILFTACNKDEPVTYEPCDYEFASVVLASETAEVGSAQDLNFAISKGSSEACETAYTMSYIVKRDGEPTTDGKFSYNDEAKEHDTAFAIEPTNFTGSFIVNNSGIAGNYEIAFTITNTDSATPVQTKSVVIALASPPIVITATSETEAIIYAKQTATYTYSLSGGGDSGGYQIKVTADDELGANLDVNGTHLDFGDFVTVSNDFTITLTPENVGENATFTVEIERNGITEKTTLNLTSKVPEFDFTTTVRPVMSGKDEITTELHLTVNVTLLNGYDQNLKYSYTPSSSDSSLDFTPKSVDEILGKPVPLFIKGFTYSSLIMSGTVNKITVKNEYGFKVTKEF